MECQCQRLADVNKCSGVQRLNELQTSVNDTVDKIVAKRTGLAVVRAIVYILNAKHRIIIQPADVAVIVAGMR